jgi:hypothetical protein
MNPAKIAVAHLCLLLTLPAAPAFRGYLVVSGRPLFLLVDREREQRQWVGSGDRFGRYLVRSFDAAREQLTLAEDDALVTLDLHQAGISEPVPAPSASLSRPANSSEAVAVLARELALNGDRQIAALLNLIEEKKTAARNGDAEAARRIVVLQARLAAMATESADHVLREK